MKKRVYLNGNPKSIGYDFNGEKAKKAYERYISINNIFENYADEEGKLQLELLLNNARDYVECVIGFERRVFIIQNIYGEESVKYKESFYKYDINRKQIHNSLISSLQGFNVYLIREYGIESKEIIPIGGIFSEDYSKIKDRQFIGDWAWYLVSGVCEIIEK